MAKEYPRIGSIQKLYKPKGLCRICGQNKSDHKVDVEINIFRGDDEVYKVHRKCLMALPPKESSEILLKGGD